MLDALKYVQAILAASGQDQGDVAWAARSEMVVQQWILGSPKLRERLRLTMPMEPVAPRDGLTASNMVRRLQGWGGTSVTHAHDLALLSEQLLLSIRHGTWSVTGDSSAAAEWARYWRPEIQAYIGAHRAVTGIDVAAPSREAAQEYISEPGVVSSRRSRAAS